MYHMATKPMTVNSLGFDLVYQVPATIHDYDHLAKKEGAALESAILNVIYRSVFADFRYAFLEAVVNNTGIERPTKAVLNKDGSPKMEGEGDEKTPVVAFVNTEKVDFDLICAKLVEEKKFASVEAAAASFKDLAQSVIDAIAFDPSETERAPKGPKKVAKAYTTIAQKAHDTGKLESLAATLVTKLGNWKVEATVDSVARAIAEDQRRQREAKNVGAEYGVDG